jgi:streptomycin 3"-adenylyltransferase
MVSVPRPIQPVADRFVADLQATLGRDLVGAYMYGSAIAGGFEPDTSDLDLVVVTARTVDDLSRAALDGLVDRLKVDEPDWADRLDIAFIDVQTLTSFRAGGPLLSVSHDEPLTRHAADEWLETWFLVRLADAPLFGPPASELIPPIQTHEFVAATSHSAVERVARLSADPRPGPRAYLVLTLGRTLRSLETRTPCSKVEGAAWIVARYPEVAATLDECLAVWRARGRLRFSSQADQRLPALIARLDADIRSQRAR